MNSFFSKGLLGILIPQKLWKIHHQSVDWGSLDWSLWGQNLLFDEVWCDLKGQTRACFPENSEFAPSKMDGWFR